MKQQQQQPQNVVRYEYGFYRIAKPAIVAGVHVAKEITPMGGEWTLVDYTGATLRDSKGRTVIVKASSDELRADGILCSQPMLWR